MVPPCCIGRAGFIFIILWGLHAGLLWHLMVFAGGMKCFFHDI